MEYITIGVLILIILFQSWANIDQRKAFESREKVLIDRIMARTYAEYVQGQVVQTPPRPLTPEEIAAMHEERGIPV
jgi:hypothetical protein